MKGARTREGRGMRGFLPGSFLCVLLLVCGCVEHVGGGSIRRAELLAQRAREQSQGGDVSGAIDLYMKSLKAEPDFARAHFDIAVLMQDRDISLSALS